MPGISVPALRLTSDSILTLLLGTEQIERIDGQPVVHVTMPIEMVGCSLNYSINDTKLVDKPLWNASNGKIHRVPVFRYLISSLDPDYHATVGMQMLLRLQDKERMGSIKSVVQRIFLRQTTKEHLYLGVFVRTQ